MKRSLIFSLLLTLVLGTSMLEAMKRKAHPTDGDQPAKRTRQETGPAKTRSGKVFRAEDDDSKDAKKVTGKRKARSEDSDNDDDDDDQKAPKRTRRTKIDDKEITISCLWKKRKSPGKSYTYKETYTCDLNDQSSIARFILRILGDSYNNTPTKSQFTGTLADLKESADPISYLKDNSRTIRPIEQEVKATVEKCLNRLTKLVETEGLKDPEYNSAEKFLCNVATAEDAQYAQLLIRFASIVEPSLLSSDLLRVFNISRGSGEGSDNASFFIDALKALGMKFTNAPGVSCDLLSTVVGQGEIAKLQLFLEMSEDSKELVNMGTEDGLPLHIAAMLYTKRKYAYYEHACTEADRKRMFVDIGCILLEHGADPEEVRETHPEFIARCEREMRASVVLALTDQFNLLKDGNNAKGTRSKKILEENDLKDYSSMSFLVDENLKTDAMYEILALMGIANPVKPKQKPKNPALAHQSNDNSGDNDDKGDNDNNDNHDGKDAKASQPPAKDGKDAKEATDGKHAAAPDLFFPGVPGLDDGDVEMQAVIQASLPQPNQSNSNSSLLRQGFEGQASNSSSSSSSSRAPMTDEDDQSWATAPQPAQTPQVPASQTPQTSQGNQLGGQSTRPANIRAQRAKVLTQAKPRSANDPGLGL